MLRLKLNYVSKAAPIYSEKGTISKHFHDQALYKLTFCRLPHPCDKEDEVVHIHYQQTRPVTCSVIT